MLFYINLYNIITIINMICELQVIVKSFASEVCVYFTDFLLLKLTVVKFVV